MHLQVFETSCSVLLLMEFWENERIWSPEFTQPLSASDEFYKLYTNPLNFLRIVRALGQYAAYLVTLKELR
jgi:hypothetical protein